MTKKPGVVAVTLTEGGNYVAFPCRHLNTPEGIRIHSIVFDDGSEWDAYNGWHKRTLTEAELAHIRKLTQQQTEAA